MDKLLQQVKDFLAKEPAIVWTSSGATLIGVVQADPQILPDWKNYITVAITILVGIIIRQGVSPTPKS